MNFNLEKDRHGSYNGNNGNLLAPESTNNKRPHKQEYNFYIKLLMLGNSGVGKSSLLSRFTDNYFPLFLMGTAGIDFKHKYVTIEEKKIKLEIFDTAGQERFHSITTNYYNGVMGIILIYDISDKISFDDVHKWMVQIKENVGEDVLIFLVGNKIDKEREVLTEEGETLAQKYKVFFVETSAKEANNVDEIFMDLVKDILKNETILSKNNENAKKLQKFTSQNLPLNTKYLAENKHLLEEKNEKNTFGCRRCCF